MDRWIVSRLQQAEQEVREAFGGYRFDMAARAIYEFVWDEYCDWYLELAKVQLHNGRRSRAARHAPHPGARAGNHAAPRPPDHSLHHRRTVAESRAAGRARTATASCCAPYPQADARPSAIADSVARIQLLKEMVNACRTLRGEMNLSPRRACRWSIGATPDRCTGALHQALARLSEVSVVAALPEADAPVAVVGDCG